MLDTGIHAGLCTRECVHYPNCLTPFSLFSKEFKGKYYIIYLYLTSAYFLQDTECQDKTTVNNKRQFAVKLHLC